MTTDTMTPIYTEVQPDDDILAFRTAGRTEEAALLAACLRRPAMFDEFREIIKFETFGWKAYGDAWAAMTKLADADQGIDPLTVGDELDRMGKLDLFMPHDTKMHSGRSGLSWIRDQGQPQNARTYAEIVQDYSAKRHLLTIANQIATWSASGRKASDILIDIEKKMATVQVGAGKASRHTATIAEAVSKAVDRTMKASRGEITYIPTGFLELDRIVTGFCAPDLWVAAGRPGMGKTAFLATLTMNAIQQGKRVAFFTLEMAMEQIAMRFISMRSGISYDKQLTGKMTSEEWEKYYATSEGLSDGSLGLYLNDMPAISPNKIRQELRRIGQVDLVVIDYIQLASADAKYDIRNLEVAAITKALKEICKEFDVPMLAAAQLNRAAEARAASDKEPILSDLGESDELGKSADKVIFIHRDANMSNEAKIIVAKQRNGPVSRCALTYVGHETRFKDAPRL